MSARAIAIHGNEMSGERRANLEIKSECPALPEAYVDGVCAAELNKLNTPH